MFGWGRKAVAAELLGNNTAAIILDADDCWRDVCELRGYKVPGPIATCEVGFARAAYAKALLTKNLSVPVARRVADAFDNYVQLQFNYGDTDETRKHYNSNLAEAAARRVEFYGTHAFLPMTIAGHLGVALAVPGPAAIEAQPIFERVEARISRITQKVKVV